jgi:4-hydroxy-3-polyprenylbenzoate decarboxylase
MAFDSLRAFVERLEAEGELLRVTAPVSPHLEITEIADRQCKAPGGGKALLFEQVEGSRFPVLINAFGSFRRLALAFGGRTPDELAGELAELLRPRAPAGLLDKLKELPGLARLAGLLPKHVRRGAGQEVVWEGEQADLGALPVLHCWPGDGGRFITLPQVYTKDPDSGVQNCGMYRLQLFSARETGMHWHPHHDGAAIYRKYEQRGARMEAAVALGGDPALTYAATAPLPAGFDELILAGYLRDKPVELVRCRTVDLHVPADADFILEGYVDPGERRREGPFGDHTGYYSLAGDRRGPPADGGRLPGKGHGAALPASVADAVSGDPGPQPAALRRLSQLRLRAHP